MLSSRPCFWRFLRCFNARSRQYVNLLIIQIFHKIHSFQEVLENKARVLEGCKVRPVRYVWRGPVKDA
jgi:hypothetical protein